MCVRIAHKCTDQMKDEREKSRITASMLYSIPLKFSFLLMAGAGANILGGSIFSTRTHIH